MNKHKVIFKGTIELSQGDIKERIPVKIICSNEDNNFIQSVQFFKPGSEEMKPKRFKGRFRYYGKSIGHHLNDIQNTLPLDI